MLFTRFIVSALLVGAGIAANPRTALVPRSNDAALAALQSLQTDVQTYTAVIKENAPYTSILNKNQTAISAIEGAVSDIAAAITKTTQAIQTPTEKRQATSTDPATEIEYILNDIASGLISTLLSVVATVIDSSAWQNITNSLLQAFTELTTALSSVFGSTPGLSAIASFFSSALSSL